MTNIVPANLPKQTREDTVTLLDRAGITEPLALVGVRGYYQRTMGDPDKNDRGIYDDAIFLVSPHTFTAFNANVDPSAFRPGIASLQPGTYRYRIGIHGLNKPKAQQYEALVQASPVLLLRDGGKRESGYFGINIHRGGRNTTSSLGCQTVPPDQWPAFISLVKSELKRSGVKSLPYLLSEV